MHFAPANSKHYLLSDDAQVTTFSENPVHAEGVVGGMKFTFELTKETASLSLADGTVYSLDARQPRFGLSDDSCSYKQFEQLFNELISECRRVIPTFEDSKEFDPETGAYDWVGKRATVYFANGVAPFESRGKFHDATYYFRLQDGLAEVETSDGFYSSARGDNGMPYSGMVDTCTYEEFSRILNDMLYEYSIKFYIP